MDSPTPPKTTSFSHQAAKLSWVCPIITIIIFALLIFDRQVVARKTIALVAAVALWLVVIGLIFGIVALFGISKHGTKGILAPAIVGIIINGLLLSFVVMNFMTSRARAMQQHGGIDASPVRSVWSNKLRGCVKSADPKFGNDHIFAMADMFRNYVASHLTAKSRRSFWRCNVPIR